MRSLATLESLRDRFDEDAERRKIELIQRLRGHSFASADQLLRFHDWLCFARAFPGSQELRDLAGEVLDGFSGRRDLKRHGARLVDTGVAGAEIRFRFFWQMARRIVPRWPGSLAIDWEEFEGASKLPGMLHLLLPYTETPALDAYDFPPREWIERLKGPEETDAAFLVHRFECMDASDAVKENLYDSLDVPLRLLPGRETPSRTSECWSASPVHIQRTPLSKERPDLEKAARSERFEVHDIPPDDARRLIDLANRAMIPRHRDLLVFLYGDERDVRMIDFGDGLQFVCIGTRPERRLMFESVYGFLTLRNGVAAGYILNSALFNSCELAYNVFETFRGVEAARVYGRFVAAVHRLFAADSFSVDPYQMGRDNEEGQQSGAFWFYYKLGFRSRSPKIRRLVRTELARMGKSKRYRTPPARIHDLAEEPVFLSFGREREDVLGSLPLGDMGLAVSAYLAKRFGSDRELALAVCADEAGELLGVRDWRSLPPGERLAFERFGPVVAALPGTASWTGAELAALRDVILKKGGPRESEYVLAFDAHRKLRRGLLRLASRAR